MFVAWPRVLCAFSVEVARRVPGLRTGDTGLATRRLHGRRLSLERAQEMGCRR